MMVGQDYVEPEGEVDSQARRSLALPGGLRHLEGPGFLLHPARGRAGSKRYKFSAVQMSSACSLLCNVSAPTAGLALAFRPA